VAQQAFKNPSRPGCRYFSKCANQKGLNKLNVFLKNCLQTHVRVHKQVLWHILKFWNEQLTVHL
jgi:hypothetical protein